MHSSVGYSKVFTHDRKKTWYSIILLCVLFAWCTGKGENCCFPLENGELLLEASFYIQRLTFCLAGRKKVGILAEITNLIYDKVPLVLKKSHTGCENQNFIGSYTFLTDSERTYGVTRGFAVSWRASCVTALSSEGSTTGLVLLQLPLPHTRPQQRTQAGKRLQDSGPKVWTPRSLVRTAYGQCCGNEICGI